MGFLTINLKTATCMLIHTYNTNIERNKQNNRFIIIHYYIHVMLFLKQSDNKDNLNLYSTLFPSFNQFSIS